MITPQVADIAHFNPIGFSQFKSVGGKGIIHKATQGVGPGRRDPKYRQRQEAAVRVDMLWGAYDFATGDDPAQNAADFLLWANLRPEDMAFLDFEDNTHSEMSAEQAYIFMDTVSQKRGRPCGIYGGNRLRDIDPATQRPRIDPQDPRWIDMAKTAPLWQCRYIKIQPDSNASLFRAIAPIAPWSRNFLIQYTGDGIGPKPHSMPGLQQGSDLDAYDGSDDDLIREWRNA